MQASGCSCPGPRAGPRDIFVLKQSHYRLFFQCPLYFLVSYLHKCWGTVGCLLCSSVNRLGVSPVCRGKWTPLPLISPPSSMKDSPVYFVPTSHASYSLYLFPPFSPSQSPIDNPPCDLHFCGSVSVLVVCLVFFCFGFRCGC